MLISNDLMWKINVGDLSIVDENVTMSVPAIRYKEMHNALQAKYDIAETSLRFFC